VSVDFMAWLEDGTLFDSTLFGEPLVFSPGSHSVMRGVEQLVIGMGVGESKTERIPPELAFGSYRPELSIPVSRRWLERYDILPEIGMALEILKRDRTLVRMIVTELNRKHVTLDANHRFAGRSIVIQLDLLAITARAGARESGAAWGNE
jgi:peptidylprolyl isomerase